LIRAIAGSLPGAGGACSIRLNVLIAICLSPAAACA
jgi:hypothetical protein